MNEIIQNYAHKIANAHVKVFVGEGKISQDIRLYKVNACYLISVKFYFDKEDGIYNHAINLIRSDNSEPVEYLTGYGESPDSIANTIVEVLQWHDVIPTE